MTKGKSIDLLNKLVMLHNDRIKGYEVALTETHDEEIQTLFLDLASTSHQCRQEWINEIHSMGGQATKDTKLAGKIFRIWMDVKAALTGRDLRYILDCCDFGESFAAELYHTISRNKTNLLSVEQIKMLKAQYESLKSDRNRLASMQKVFVFAK